MIPSNGLAAPQSRSWQPGATGHQRCVAMQAIAALTGVPCDHQFLGMEERCYAGWAWRLR